MPSKNWLIAARSVQKRPRAEQVFFLYSSEKVMWMMMMGPAPENAGLAIKHFDWPPTVSDPPSTS